MNILYYLHLWLIEKQSWKKKEILMKKYVYILY